MATDVPPRWSTSSDSTLVYRLTVDEYERLVAAGMLDDLQVEFIDGFLVRKAIRGPRHALALDAAYDRLDRLLPPGWSIREEKPVRISRFDEPAPDLSVVRDLGGESRGQPPGPEDVALLVEVADGSLEIDRGVKRAGYATGGIPVYWIINLVDGQVEVYSDPRRGEFGSSEALKPGQCVPFTIDGETAGRIAVAHLLP